MIPGVEETPATIAAGFPWVRQARALLEPSELQGLAQILKPTVPDLAQIVAGQVNLLPVLDEFDKCQYNTVLPAGEQTIDDGNLTTGIQNYKEFFQSLAGLVGAGQNFTGNGVYTRFQPGGGAYPDRSARQQSALRKLHRPAPGHAPGAERQGAVQAQGEVLHPAGARPELGQDGTRSVKRQIKKQARVFAAIIVLFVVAIGSRATSCPTSGSTCRRGCRWWAQTSTPIG